MMESRALIIMNLVCCEISLCTSDKFVGSTCCDVLRILKNVRKVIRWLWDVMGGVGNMQLWCYHAFLFEKDCKGELFNLMCILYSHVCKI